MAGLGLTAVFAAILLAVLKRNAQLRRWQNFKDDLEGWAVGLLSTDDRHPKELDEEEWRAECESMLHDARFTPTEISQIMDLAIIAAKNHAHLLVVTSPDQYDDVLLALQHDRNDAAFRRKLALAAFREEKYDRALDLLDTRPR